jgi:hypothetical protein
MNFEAANAKVCRSCSRLYVDDPKTDEFGTGLCSYCFEGGLEEYEDRRRERIARENEY